MISSVIGAIQSVTPYQKLDRDLTIPPVEVFPADKGKDIGVTIFPKPILDIPDVDSIPATEREKNVIIENPPYIPKSIIDIFPEHVNQGETIIRMDEGFRGNEDGSVRTTNPFDLQPTHSQTLSKNKMNTLMNDIKVNGIHEPIKYVEYNGQMYVVDGHHRLLAAKRLGLAEVPIERVELPYAGYSTIDDLLWFD